MGMNLLKLQLVYYNFSYKAPLIKIFLLATLMAAIPCFNLLVQIDMINGCDWSFPVPPISRVDANSTVQETSNFPVNVTAVFEMLLQEGWLKRGDRAVCVGPGSAAAVMEMRRMGVRGSFGTCGMRGGEKSLPFGDNWAEFVYSEALERVRVPARLVMEMERVLRPGRAGVIFQAGTMGRAAGPRTATMLIKAAVPVSSFLRFSDVVGVREVNSSALVIFRKRGSPAAGSTGKTLRRVTLPAPLVASS